MRLIIDSREGRLLECLGEMEGCEKEFLPLADIVFRDDEAEVFVERKTWNDLWSSIQDGRFREQRSRLMEWKEEATNRVAAYLIEGSEEKIPEDALETSRGALYRLMMGYHIPVFFTKDPEDTARWVRWIFDKKELRTLLRTSDTTEQRMESVQQRLQKKSIENPKNMLVAFLRSISGVSYPLAQAIAEPFDSLSGFVSRKDELAAMLPHMTYLTPSKKHKKIGPKLTEKILALLG